jgi:hypothetical protein
MGKPWKSYPLWLGLVLCTAIACGDDDGGPKEPEGPEGEPCFAVGQTMTGCKCSDAQPLGSRQCIEGMVWSACSCAPALGDSECAPGQNVRCGVCPGEAAGRIVECTDQGTFDCACPMPDAAAPVDAGSQPDAAAPPPPGDAG